MGYFPALLMLAVAALAVLLVRSPNPHPRREFMFGMVARLAAADAGDAPYSAPPPQTGEDEAA